MKSTLTTVLALATAALASPIDLAERATTSCSQYDTISAGPYNLFTNLWGEAGYTGSQCSTLNSQSGNTISWSTSWTWSGGPYQVKSYSDVGLVMSDTQISTIKTIPTTWSWSYTGSNIIGDVSYDMFTTSSSGGSAQYEIMVWLAALGGAGPISASGSPIATPTIGGVPFKLYSGPNGATTVYSFVATSEQTNYSGDLINFFNFLESNEGFSKSQYLMSIQAGTEPFTGSNAVLTTSKYSVQLN